jgi:DNA polymerase-3 subunit delta
VEALPVFASRRKVLLADLDPSKLEDEDIKTLENILGDRPESTLLIITARDPGFASGSAGKKITALADRLGTCAEFAAPSERELTDFCVAFARERGCDLRPDTAGYLLRICDTELYNLENELKKLCAFKQSGEITRADADALITPKTEARIFDLQKFILAGNAGEALGLLGRLFALREEPVSILATLSMSFCDLYRGRAAKKAGKGPSELAGDFGYKSSWRAQNAYKNAGRLSAGAVRRAVSLLCDCDRRMKSTSVGNELLLEEAVVRLILLCAEGRGAV